MTVIVFLKTILFLCSICLLGFFVASVISSIFRSSRNADIGMYKLPLFFLLGGGVYTFYGMLLSISGVKSGLANFLTLFIFFGVIHVILSLKRRNISPGAPLYTKNRKSLVAGIVIILVIGVPLLTGLAMAISFPQFDIDMLGHILIKAKILTTDTYKSTVFLHDEMFANLHSRYPPFVAIFYNLLFLFGANTISSYQVVNYFIFLLLGITIYSYLKQNIPLWQALAWFFIFISTSGYISSQFIIDSTDILLSLSFLLSLLWLIEFYKKQDNHSLIMYALLVGFTTFIKDEALVFCIIGALLLVKMNIGIRKALKYLFIVSAVSLPWILYRQALPNPDLNTETLIKTVRLAQIAGNIKYTASTALPILLKEWNSAFVLWIPSLFFLAKSKEKTGGAILSVTAGILLPVYFLITCIFVGNTVNLGSGFFRILSHIYPMVFICLAMGVKELLGPVGFAEPLNSP